MHDYARLSGVAFVLLCVALIVLCAANVRSSVTHRVAFGLALLALLLSLWGAPWLH